MTVKVMSAFSEDKNRTLLMPRSIVEKSGKDRKGVRGIWGNAIQNAEASYSGSVRSLLRTIHSEAQGVDSKGGTGYTEMVFKEVIDNAYNFADGRYDRALEKFAETTIIRGASEDGLRLKAF